MTKINETESFGIFYTYDANSGKITILNSYFDYDETNNSDLENFPSVIFNEDSSTNQSFQISTQSSNNTYSNIVSNLIGGIADAVEQQMKSNGGSLLSRGISVGQIQFVGGTMDYLNNLKNLQQQNPGAYSNYLAAFGQAAGPIIAGAAATAAFAGSLGFFGAIGAGFMAGMLANALFDAKLFGDLSMKDKIADYLKDFDLDAADLMLDENGNLRDIEDIVKDLFGNSEIGENIQDFLDNLFGAESSSALQRVDPLSLDLDGDGIELVNVDNSTAFFDLDVTQEFDANGNETGNYISDGVKEQVGWVKGDDGLLVLDKNGNGLVDNILELFGKSNKTGTEELREYDLNGDGKIDANDAVFSELKVWQDVNQNGVSEVGELKSLSNLGISSINVSDSSLTQLNQINNDNLVISNGSYTKSDGTIGTYSNLDLAVNQANSSSYSYTDSDGNVVGDYDLNLDVLSLPFIRGYGNVEALPIAASKNSELLSSLKELRDLSDASYNQIDALVEKVIYEWSSVTNISESSLRGNFSAQKLAAMESFRGQSFVAANGSSDSTTNQQFNLLTSAWNSLFEDVKVKLVVQSTFSDVFSYEVVTEIAESTETITTTSIDPNTGEEITVTETVTIPASTSTETFSPTYDFASDSIDFNDITAEQVFLNVSAKLESLVKEVSTASDAEVAGKINNIYAINNKIVFLDQIKSVIDVIANQNLISGLDEVLSNQTFDGFYDNLAGDELSLAYDKNHINNSVYDNGGGDVNALENSSVIIGGAGDDSLTGLKGNDVYLFNLGDGKDIISESGSLVNNILDTTSYGNDTILMGEGISKDDVYFSGSAASYDLIVKFKNNNSDQITIKNHNTAFNKIETILFSDGSTIDLTDLSNIKLSFFGDDGNNTISTTSLGDEIDAGLGDDVVKSFGGSNIFKRFSFHYDEDYFRKYFFVQKNCFFY